MDFLVDALEGEFYFGEDVVGEVFEVVPFEFVAFVEFHVGDFAGPFFGAEVDVEVFSGGCESVSDMGDFKVFGVYLDPGFFGGFANDALFGGFSPVEAAGN